MLIEQRILISYDTCVIMAKITKRFRPIVFDNGTVERAYNYQQLIRDGLHIYASTRRLVHAFVEYMPVDFDRISTINQVYAFI